MIHPQTFNEKLYLWTSKTLWLGSDFDDTSMVLSICLRFCSLDGKKQNYYAI